MLAQELHADVHQLHRVQRTAPVIRIARRVGGFAVEFIQHLYAGVVRTCRVLVHVRRVPRKRRVQRVPRALARHIRLARAALFAGAAEIYHRAGLAAQLQILFHRYRRRKRTRAQQIMPAAVTAAAGNKRSIFLRARRLRQAGQRVELAEDADHRLALAEFAGERGLYPADILLDLEALGAQRIAV